MTIAILADESQRMELLTKSFIETELLWADTVQVLCSMEADMYFDLQFHFDRERVEKLKRLLPSPVFINCVDRLSSELPMGFFRINAWPTMLSRPAAEVVIGKASLPSTVSKWFSTVQWPIEPVQDTIGMIVPRILSTIINEAFFTLEAGVSSREEIDLAMKFGTNYPRGPFEWCDAIGARKVTELLMALRDQDARYTIANSLILQSSTNQ